MKKNYEKIVPVALAGLVLSGAGAVEAQAVELEAKDLETREGEEQQKETSAPSTEIKKVTPVVTEPGEDGSTETDAVVNLDVDTDNDETTDDGEITVTETPDGDPTTENVPDPDREPTTETVTNPDGSTTTTTTTPTIDVTTENSTTEITGTITPGQTGTPSEEETGKIEDDVKEEVGKEENKKADGTIDWDKVEQSYKDKDSESKVESSEDGKTHTITFKETSEGVSNPLNDEELAKVLGVDRLEPVADQENTYTYQKDGATVTINVTNRTGTETETTLWTITVTETEKTVGDHVDNVDTPTYITPGTTPIEDEDEDLPSAEEVLTHITDTDWKDDVAEWKDGTVTYTVKRELVETKTNIEGLSSGQIEALLPAGSEITLKEDGEFYKVIDGVERKLTFDEVQAALTQTTYKFTVTKTDAQGGFTTPTEDGKDEALKAAEKAAVVDAAGKVGAAEDAVYKDNGDGTWTVTWKDAAGHNHELTVKGEASKDGEIVWKADDELSGTQAVTGSAYVSAGNEKWDSEIGTLTLEEGKVKFEKGDPFGGGTVETINDDGSVTVRIDENTTRRYTFTYADVTDANLTPEQKLELLKAAGVDVTAEGFDPSKYSLSELGVQEITWKYTETTTGTGTVEGSENQTILQGDLSLSNGKYTFKDGKDTITFENGNTYTSSSVSADGKTETKTTYTLVEEKVSLTGLNKDQIQAILGEDYEVLKVENGVITAKYKGQEVTVDAAKEYTKLTVKKETSTTTSKTLAESGIDQKKAKDDLLAAIKKEVGDAKERNEKVYLTYKGQEYLLDVQGDQLVGFVEGNLDMTMTPGQWEEWIKSGTAINFDAMDKDDLVKYLDDLKTDGKDSIYNHYHLELVVGGKLHVEETGKDEDCAVIGKGLTVTVSKNSSGVVYDTGTKTAGLKENIEYDNAAGSYQYTRSEDEALKVGRGEKKYEFYKVEGTVAYGLYTGEKATTQIKNGKEEKGIIKNWQTAEQVRKDLNRKNGKADNAEDGAYVMDYGGYYKVFESRAKLEAYGYLGDASNVCAWQKQKWNGDYEKCTKNHDHFKAGDTRGYDLSLSNLTLLKDGKVTASGENTYSYSADLKIKKGDPATTVATGSSLHVNKLTTDTSNTDPEQDGGQELKGGYKVTLSKDVMHKVEGKDVYDFDGSGSGSYNVSRDYAATTRENYSSAEGSQFSGSLNYHYQIPNAPEITVEGVTSLNREVNVSLSSTAVSQAPGEDDVVAVVTPAPETPTPDDPIVIPPTDVTPAPTPTPGGGGGTGTATPAPAPVATIADEATPLAEIPDEQTPLAETPTEDLMDIADEAVPLAEIPDEETPLAEIPHTGDSMILQAFAAMSGSLSAAWLALNRKRRS